MWLALRNLVLAGALYKFLRGRGKRLAICLGIVVLAFYAHGEYLSYLQALPDSDVSGDAVFWPFALKNLVIVGAVIVALVPEFRTRSIERRSASSVPEEGRLQGSRQTTSSLIRRNMPSDKKPDPPGKGAALDPYEVIRGKRRLRTRAEQTLEDGTRK